MVFGIWGEDVVASGGPLEHGQWSADVEAGAFVVSVTTESPYSGTSYYRHLFAAGAAQLQFETGTGIVHLEHKASAP